ncbi:hypothetical protein RIR_jg7733.t1 [Rhizophagus irregularis DAOM 181602=DAOM 197198]|nr:hypothetical protein RIR_jg7733.t1 [Rhizophagus irregularis DAOM 181602=DAOM 197198]
MDQQFIGCIDDYNNLRGAAGCQYANSICNIYFTNITYGTTLWENYMISFAIVTIHLKPLGFKYKILL